MEYSELKIGALLIDTRTQGIFEIFESYYFGYKIRLIHGSHFNWTIGESTSSLHRESLSWLSVLKLIEGEAGKELFT